MKRIFSLILFVIFSNEVIAFAEGETIICDKDTRGYDFISKDKVKISSINLNKLDIFSVNHSYEVAENAIFIKKPNTALEKKEKPVGY